MVIDDTNQTIEITVPERLRLRGINYINMDQGKNIITSFLLIKTHLKVRYKMRIT